MSTHEPKSTLPSISEFCLSVPLYLDIDLTDIDNHSVFQFVTAAVNIDCFCVDCQKDSVFNGDSDDVGPSYNFTPHNRIFLKKFNCSRVPKHEIYFIFQIKNQKLFKIGQYPSMADISMQEIGKYRKVLREEDYKELHRGVGLVTHGVGIGAFVYLRRIFEKLIESAHDKAKAEKGWNEEEYINSRVSERIEFLKHHLPEFLVQQKALYGILSKGVHELTEQDCLAAFPVVKLGIELILDEEIERKKRGEKLKAATKDIALLREKHK